MKFKEKNEGKEIKEKNVNNNGKEEKKSKLNMFMFKILDVPVVIWIVGILVAIGIWRQIIYAIKGFYDLLYGITSI